MAIILTVTREVIHQKLCKHLYHYFQSKNWTGLSRIIFELPNGVTKRKVIFWVERFSPLRLKVSLDKTKPVKFSISSESYEVYDLAKDTPYWTMKLPDPLHVKPRSIAGSLNILMHKFINDPSDTNQLELLQTIDSYKKFGVSPVKNRLKITPANLFQGGLPGSRR